MPATTDMDPRSIEDREHRIAEIDERLRALQRRFDGRKFDDSARAEWNELNGERDTHSAVVDQMRRRRARLEQLAGNPDALERGEPVPAVLMGGGGRRGLGGDVFTRARRAIDVAHNAGQLPDHAAENATRLVEHGDRDDRELAARWAAATGDPDYLSAFTKWVADPSRGHMLWTPEEADAYRAVAEVRAAMSTGATQGGEMIPLTLDPAIMLTSAGSINPLRRLARVVQTVTHQWTGVTSAGATAEWKAEGVEAAAGDPTLAELVIPVFFGDVNVTYSYEVGMDAANFASELQKVMADAADQLQATAFTTGNGTTAPAGVVTGATSVNNASGAFVAADLYTLQNSLPARWSEAAQWASNLAVANRITEFETTNGNLKFPEIRDGRLLNKPWNEISNMTADFATTSSKFLLYGDFGQFIIADRVGTMLEILPAFGTSHRPTGQRHAFMTFRTGSKVAVPAALRVLNKTA